MRNFIPEHTWESVHRAWSLGAQSVMQIARDHGIHNAEASSARPSRWGINGACVTWWKVTLDMPQETHLVPLT